MLRTAAIVGLLAAASTAWAGERVRVVKAPQRGQVPDAAIDDKGTLHVAYLAGSDVMYAASLDLGKSFTKPVRVNTEEGFAAGGAFRGPDLAIGKDRRVHVIWYNAGYQQKRPKNEWGVTYAYKTERGPAFTKSRNLNRKPSDNFSLAADGKGGVAVVWMADGVFVNRSKNGGKTFSKAAKLDADPCECCGSRALYHAGGLSIMYRSKTNNMRDTILATLGKGGRSFAHRKISQTPWPIKSCPMTGSYLETRAGGLVAAWQTKSAVYLGWTDAKGRPRGREVKVTDNGRYPVALSAADGTTVVAWKQGTKLVWQTFDESGKRVGEQGSSQSGSKHRPTGVVTKAGEFLLIP